MSTPAIEIHDLVHRYGRTEALHGLSLTVEPGQCYGFFGRNGAGKTTTIKCLLNLLRPDAGTVRVFGLDPAAAAIATLGLLATALFLLTFWQRVFHEPRAGVTATAFAELSAVELVTLVPLVALMFVFGLFPGLLTGLFNPLITSWADHLTLP